MSLPKISVIMPVFNTEKFLNKSINSVLNQTYPNVELVIINDGSTDGSETVIQDIMKNTNKIVYLKNDINVGSLESRLSAFKHSSGDYIAFLDSDDSIDRDYLRKMLDTIQTKDADICFADWIYEYDTNEKKYIPFEEIRNLDFEYTNKEILDKFSQNHGFHFSWQVLWNKMLTRELMERSYEELEAFSQKVGKLIMCEDIAYCFTFYMFANKVVNCHNVSYHYYQHANQSIKVTSKEKYRSNFFDVTRVFDYIFDFFKKYNKYDEYKNDLMLWKNTYYSNYHKIANDLGYLDAFKEVSKGKSFELINTQTINFYTVDYGKEYDKYEEIISAIMDANTEVVSFDIFDTLIKRRTYLPTDIFVLVANALKNKLTNVSYLDYRNVRIAAENGARKNAKNKEVNIQDIYQYMVKEYHFDQDLAQLLMSKEIEIEQEMCISRQTGKDLYKIAEINNKQIIYVSDMYLPKDIIYKILENNGYSVNNLLFLSNDLLENKYSGGLFKSVLSKLKIKAGKIVHIGDYDISDVKVPISMGIKGFLLPSVKDKFKTNIFDSIVASAPTDMDILNINFIGVRNIFATIANELFDFPFLHNNSLYQCSPKVIGYFALGTFLYAFIDWIRQNSDNSKKLHFVARDGYLPMKAYKIFSKYYSGLSQTNYLYMSRKFAYPLMIRDKRDLFCTINMFITNTQSIEKILGYFPQSCINHNVHNLSKTVLSAKFKRDDDLCKAIDIIDKCIDYKALKKYQQQCKEYLSTVINDGDIMIDIGYSGRCESVLSKLLGKEINSLYVNSNSDLLELNSNVSFFKNKCFMNYKPKVTGELRELLFMDGFSTSFKLYDFNNGAKPIFEDNKKPIDNNLLYVNAMQINALKFVNDVLDGFKNHLDLMIYHKDYICYPLEHYIHQSNMVDKFVFSGFKFSDGICFENIDLIGIWNIQNYNFFTNCNNNYIQDNRSFIRLVGDKLLPFGTRRRGFVKRCINFLIPKGSKRRFFVKKLLGK